MYASKRKFQRLLESLSTNRSLSDSRDNSSSTTLPANLESQTKRRRLARPVSEIIASAKSIASTPEPGTQTAPSIIRVPAPKQSLPNYAPWDRGQFLGRLKTFRHVDKWSAKPVRANEVQWAKRGWSCVGKERVGCVSGCGKEVYVNLEDRTRIGLEQAEGLPEDEEGDEWKISAYEQLVDRYVEMIVTEHDEHCLWQRRGCDDAIYRLPLNQPAISVAALRSRYASIISIASALPPNVSYPDSPDFNAILRNPPALGEHSATSSDSFVSAITGKVDAPNQEALILALLGWQAEEGHVAGLVTCAACFRRLGLWLFSRPLISSADVNEGEASMNRLDVVAEHRDYCPWVNADSQAGSSSTPKKDILQVRQPGWEILVRVLRSQQRLQEGSEPRTSDVASEAYSIEEEEIEEDANARSARDEERWVRLKKLKKVFQAKRNKASAESGNVKGKIGVDTDTHLTQTTI